MRQKDQDEVIIHNDTLDLSIDELKGRQSVRATFRLPKQAIELLSVIASQLGIKQKSLFDQLVENISVLGRIAQEARNFAPGETERQQKTFVISRNSLVALDYIARQQGIPRDVLVEFSIRRLLPVIESELQKHEKRKILLKEMQDYLRQGQKILKRAADLIGKDEQLYQIIEQQVTLGERNAAMISSMIEKGRAMEEW
ncbi:MAG: hypothetical protein KKC76_14225 [Proteobacteria bacterium]|nr:hypothetical protein [Pseudomonadota bacterium]MBU4294644.1 hypothetical protein [Pseudomonadota bacterium]MCG2745917.1 hypothetical protein [Desulfobulbaceae bacterium]